MTCKKQRKTKKICNIQRIERKTGMTKKIYDIQRTERKTDRQKQRKIVTYKDGEKERYDIQTTE